MQRYRRPIAAEEGLLEMRSSTASVLNVAIALLLIVLVTGCNGGSGKTEQDSQSIPSQTVAEEGVLTESGLRYIEIEEGHGPAPKTGDIVLINYVGTLEDGTEFVNTYDQGTPQPFMLGRGQILPGIEEGVRLMRLGGKAKLVVPPELGYGDYDAGIVPAGSTLYFDVELVALMPAAQPTPVPEEQYKTSESGLKFYDITVGNGVVPEPGQMVLIDFSMWLEDGSLIRTSADLGGPTTLVIGSPNALAGLSEGLQSMHVGGKRQLVIPPKLGHGEQGTEGGLVPPNTTLTVEVKLLAVIPWEPDPRTEVDEANYVTTESGLKYYDIVVGDGPLPKEGQAAVVQFTGWLTDGTQFSSSMDSGQPVVAYVLGSGKQPKGFEEGISTMHVGGKRQLVVPPELGFGEEGKDNVPPDSTLIYEVELFYAFTPTVRYR